MSSDKTDSISKCPVRGEYVPSTTSDIRSPCPLINSLANHGYIPRDGRNVLAAEIMSALSEVGVASTLGSALTNPIYLEHKDPNTTASQKQISILGKIWYLIRNPWAILFSKFGLRRPGQVDTQGRKCLDLDQLALPGAVEHDVSLSRRDFAQGDNISPQPDLIRDILASSTDGGKTLTMSDLVAFRKRRIEQQEQDNPNVLYGKLAHQISCGEISLILQVFGNGESVPCEYARAFFQEERLPIQEGWNKRWWSIGVLELVKNVEKVKKMMGMKVE